MSPANINNIKHYVLVVFLYNNPQTGQPITVHPETLCIIKLNLINIVIHCQGGDGTSVV